MNNATAIGANAEVDEPNALVLGSILNINGCFPANNCTNVNVGIGTTKPAYTLDVNGIIRSSSGGFMFPDGTVQTTKASGGGGSGTVTSVGSGSGLIGGPITTSGTLAIDTSLVPLLSASNTFGNRVQFGFLALASGIGISRVFAHRQPHALRALAPFEVVRAFLMSFLLATDSDETWLDAAIGGEHNTAIPPSTRCLDSFGEINFAIHRRSPYLSSVSV
jgi:hypothetical protein